MIIRAEELPVEHRTGERSGEITRLVPPEKMQGRNRIFARVLLNPGAQISYHEHQGEFEVYYILSGTGRVNDNGVLTAVKAGDIVFTGSGQGHSLENTGESGLEYIALVTLL